MRRFNAVLWLSVVLSLFASYAQAAPSSCSVHGQDSFTVSFTVTGSENYQEFYFKQGGHGNVLWYTKAVNTNSAYVFNEQQLVNNVQYNVVITHNVSTSIPELKYYLKRADSTEWQLIETRYQSLEQGELKPELEGSISDISCSTSVTPPTIPPLDNICDYVPSVAQTNNYYQGEPTNGTLAFSGADNLLIVPQDNLKLSFHYQIGNSQCRYPSTTKTCEVSRTIKYDNFPVVLPVYDVSTRPNFVCQQNTSCTLNAGHYNSVEVKQNAVLTLLGGHYRVGTLNFSGDSAQLRVSNVAQIDYQSIKLAANNIKINQGGLPDNLRLIGHGATSYFIVQGDNLEISGFIYIDHNATAFGGFDIVGTKNKISGGMTAYNFYISGRDNTFNGVVSSSCDNPPQDNYTLELVPSSGIALTCETLTPTVRVLNNGVLATNFTGSVTALIDGVAQQLTPVNGVLSQTLTLGVTQTKTVAVEAYINGDQANTTVTGQYEFVPFKFAIDDQYVIAGKPQLVNAKVLACNAGETVDIGYNGKIIPTFTIEQPTSGIGELDYTPMFAAGVSNSDLTFNDSGVVLVELKDENFDCTGVQGCPIEGSGMLKGQFHVYSRPWTFAICNADDPVLPMDGTSSSGPKFKLASERFNLHVKPIVWQSDGAVTGEIETSGYCAPAVDITQNFFASNAPSAVVAMSSDLHSPSNGVDVLLTSEDGLNKVNSAVADTGPYYKFSKLYWDEVGSLKVMVDTQANYLGMDINLGFRNIGRFVPEKLVLASNSWTYPTGHSGFAYMNQPIEHAFGVEAQNASDQVTQNYGLFDSAYVSTVSYFNVDNTHNEIVDRVKDYSTLTWQQPAWSSGKLNISLVDFEFAKKATASTPYTTEPDGPFTQGFGLWVSNVVDGVDFESTDLQVSSGGVVARSGKAFPNQPDFRYGRMQLQDVGGHTGNKISVPLRVEYWNGSQFVTNGDDSGSDFDGSQLCRQLIWHSQAQTRSNASLSGNDVVAIGTSDQLFAQQSTTDTDDQIREQVRFWLRVSDTTLQKVATADNDIECIGSGARPWLRFNWRNKGDEDPNAVVTFGINRGNDRVIYKGESGLTGQ